MDRTWGGARRCRYGFTIASYYYVITVVGVRLRARPSLCLTVDGPASPRKIVESRLLRYTLLAYSDPAHYRVLFVAASAMSRPSPRPTRASALVHGAGHGLPVTVVFTRVTPPTPPRLRAQARSMLMAPKKEVTLAGSSRLLCLTLRAWTCGRGAKLPRERRRTERGRAMGWQASLRPRAGCVAVTC